MITAGMAATMAASLGIAANAEEATYKVGICQLIQHEALDAATQGFQDALTEKLGDRVEFDVQNASGESVNCSTIINGFVSDQVDLILANATGALQAAVAGTSDIPILGTAVTDYATALDIDDWTGTVGGNVSGTSDCAPLDQQAAMILELVPEDLKKPELTADWEKKLSDIAKGKLRQDTFLSDIRDYTNEIVSEIKTGQGTFRHDNLTNKICPTCGKRLLAVNGKNSKMLVCQDRECGYRETISRTTNARCPKCHKRMEMLVKGKEETFVCVCGYKEKLSSFQARREKEGAGVKKRDVQRYLKQQQKEANEPVNNAFAQALAGLKLD